MTRLTRTLLMVSLTLTHSAAAETETSADGRVELAPGGHVLVIFPGAGGSAEATLQYFFSPHQAVGAGLVVAALRFESFFGGLMETNFVALARAKLIAAFDDEARWRLDFMAAIGPEYSYLAFGDGSHINDTGFAFLGGVGLSIERFHMAVEYFRSGTRNCDYDYGACWPTPSGLALSAGVVWPLSGDEL